MYSASFLSFVSSGPLPSDSDATTEFAAFVRTWLISVHRRSQIISQDYFDGTQDILKKDRKYTSQTGVPLPYPSSVPNTQLVDNLYRKIVAQKVGFVSKRKLRFFPLDAPPVDYSDPSSVLEAAEGDVDPVDGYDVEEKEDVPILSRDTTAAQDLCKHFLRCLDRLFDKTWYAKFHDAMTDCLIDGDCWLYPYIDSRGDFAYHFFRGRDILPIYSDELCTELVAIVRVFEVSPPSSTNQVRKFVEIYRKEDIVRYELEEKGASDGKGVIAQLVNGSISNYFTVSRPVSSTSMGPSPVVSRGYHWDKLPFLHITQSYRPQPLLSRCKTILDSINMISSNWCDCIQSYPDGGILIVQNYGGENFGEMWSQIANNHAIKVTSTQEMPGGDARYLEVPLKSQDYTAIITHLRKTLFEVCCAFDDTSESVFTSNLHELTIKTAMLSMEQDAEDLVSSVERALHSFVYDFFCPYLLSKGFEDYSDVSMEIRMDDGRLRNVAEITNLMVSLGMKLSNRTMLEHHPWVEDVDEELDRIMQEENMQQMRMMASSEEEEDTEGEGPDGGTAPFGLDSSGTVNTGSPDGGGKPNDFSKAYEHRNDETSKSEKKTTPER